MLALSSCPGLPYGWRSLSARPECQTITFFHFQPRHRVSVKRESAVMSSTSRSAVNIFCRSVALSKTCVAIVAGLCERSSVCKGLRIFRHYLRSVHGRATKPSVYSRRRTADSLVQPFLPIVGNSASRLSSLSLALIILPCASTTAASFSFRFSAFFSA